MADVTRDSIRRVRESLRGKGNAQADDVAVLLAEYERLRSSELEAGTTIAEAGDCYATDCPFCGVDCAVDEEAEPVHSEDCPCAYNDMAMWVRCLVSLHGCESHVATIARDVVDLPPSASPKEVRDALEGLRHGRNQGAPRQPTVSPPPPPTTGASDERDESRAALGGEAGQDPAHGRQCSGLPVPG